VPDQISPLLAENDRLYNNLNFPLFPLCGNEIRRREQALRRHFPLSWKLDEWIRSNVPNTPLSSRGRQRDPVAAVTVIGRQKNGEN